MTRREITPCDERGELRSCSSVDVGAAWLFPKAGSMTQGARYILAKKIARGGMAEIYLGKHVGEDGFQRLCAIKRILPHYSQDQEFIQMFRDEAHICKRLQHANIVRVEGFEEVEGSYAIIMEFLDGADLRTLLHAVEQAKKRMMVPMACYIIAEAARGLHYAHTKIDEVTQQPLGIVHRDISPQNILVSYEGEVKITDFGIADAESKLTETRPGIVKGKYSYMSPEQISAKPVDCRTDIFALSIVLWEMMAMRRLFQGDNEVDTIQRVKNCRIDHELRQLNADVDEELDQIVKRGLAKDPKKRYKTAADFEKDLRRYMSRKHPDFTPEDLGNFLKKIMESRRNESAADIKKTLTETNQRPQKSQSISQKKLPGIDVDPASGPQIALARKSFVPGSTPQRPAPAPAARTTTSLGKPGAHFTRAPEGGFRRQHSSHLFVYVALAVLAVFAGFRVVASFSAEQKPAHLILRTLPSRVKITVDGKPKFNGRYVHASSRSPLHLPLTPGEHTLIVQREGYTPYQYTFRLDDGDKQTKDDIVLTEQSPLAQFRIKLKAADRLVKIDVNDGYFIATLGPSKAPSVAPDVLQNVPYRVKVSPEGERDFLCHFTAKSNAPRAPNELIIDRKTRRCVMSGP